jgi:hypothetical protein
MLVYYWNKLSEGTKPSKATDVVVVAAADVEPCGVHQQVTQCLTVVTLWQIILNESRKRGGMLLFLA